MIVGVICAETASCHRIEAWSCMTAEELINVHRIESLPYCNVSARAVTDAEARWTDGVHTRFRSVIQHTVPHQLSQRSLDPGPEFSVVPK